MDIFIKSFNRPYQLDRCIYSIKKFVSDYDKIIILDDGTPQKYLDKLKRKHTEIIVLKSEFYEVKSKAIEDGVITKDKLKFPGEFWHREIVKGSEFFLLLEDDFFIIQPFKLNEIEKLMKEHNLHQYKMIWLGRKEYKFREIKTVEDSEIIVAKSKFFSSENFRRISFNKLRLRNLFEKLLGRGSYFKHWLLPFYKFYTVAGAVYSKKIFDAMWTGIENLDEPTQIYRMLRFHEDNNIRLKIGKPKIEAIQTTFLTSATNEFPEINFSIFQFNKLINEAWFNDQLNPIFRFPQDYGKDYYKNFIPEATRTNYDKWIEKFSAGYIKLGCTVNTQ